jgi:hypothetical protein
VLKPFFGWELSRQIGSCTYLGWFNFFRYFLRSLLFILIQIYLDIKIVFGYICIVLVVEESFFLHYVVTRGCFLVGGPYRVRTVAIRATPAGSVDRSRSLPSMGSPAFH